MVTQVTDEDTSRSKEEIDAEIAKLKEMKEFVLKESMFGDNHHDAIDAQVTVLEDNLTDTRIYNLWGNIDSDDFQQNVLDDALKAHNWREGVEDEAPSIGWAELDRRNTD